MKESQKLRPVPDQMENNFKKEGQKLSDISLGKHTAVVVLSSIFVGELFIMLLGKTLNVKFTWFDTLIDSSLLALLISPVIYLFVIRPLTIQLTGRKKAEEMVLEREADLNRAQKAAQCGSWKFDVNTRMISWSENMYCIFGLDPKDGPLDYPGHKRIIYPDDWEEFDSAVQETSKTGKGYKLKIRIIRPDGQLRWITIECEMKKDIDGHVVDLFGITQDISERKHAEEQIKTMLHTMIDGFYLVDTEGRILETNDSYCSMIGYSREELLTMKVKDIEAVESEEVIKKRLQRLLVIGNDFFETRHLRKDGRVIDIEASVNFLMDDQPKLFCFMRDITERKRAEETLRKSEEEFRFLAEAMPQIVWITRPDGWNIYFNQQWVEYTGQSLEESYGDGWNKPFHPDDQQRAWDAWQNATKSGTIYSLDCRLRRADGAYNWFLIRGVPVLDSNGNILKWFGTCTDINEYKLAEEAMLESERNLKDAQELAEIGSWKWNVASNTVQWSDQLCKMNGHDPELPIPLFAEMSSFYTPQSWEQLNDAVQKALTTGKSYELELDLVRKNGTIIKTISQGVVDYDNKGDIVSLHGTVQDITERKQAEEALRKSEITYRSLFENMLNGFAYCKMYFDENNRPVDFTYLAVNKSFEKLTGLKNVVGMKVTEVIPGIRENDPELFEIYGRVVRSDKHEQFETYLSTMQMWFLVSVYSLEQDCFVAVFDVITDRKKAEEEIRNSNDIREQLLKRLNEIRENERALISREIHDQLGQSMTALKLDLNWLQGSLTSNTEIKEKLSSMVTLITETIRDVQRISSELRPGILDDLGLAAAIEWYAEEFEKRTGLEVLMDLDEVQTNSDSKNLAIFRVLQEALTNVIRHAHAQTVQITLHEINEHIVLDIEDNGIGMSIDKLKSRQSLGLLGMHDRIKQAGGTLDILCGSDAGTKVRICVPLVSGLSEFTQSQLL